jgi:hypothetical protein
MDLHKALLASQAKAQVNRIVNYIGSDAKRFDILVKLFLTGPYRVTQRAAGPLSYCIERSPHLANGKLGTLLSAADSRIAGDAVKRNVVRLLQFIEIPKRNHGRVVALCSRLLSSSGEPIAVRVFSMTVLSRLSKVYPELKEELKLVIESHLPLASPAFQSRARKVLKEIKE